MSTPEGLLERRTRGQVLQRDIDSEYDFSLSGPPGPRVGTSAPLEVKVAKDTEPWQGTQANHHYRAFADAPAVFLPAATSS